MKKIAIIGLGYVGLPLAVEFGKVRPVMGFDINPVRVQELQSGKDHTLECSPEQLRQATQLSYSCAQDDLNTCQIFVVTVPTPVDKANRPDMTPLVKASETVGKALKKGDIVIYESTVYPGATEEVCVPVLEKFSGLKFNQDFFCGYSPERINPGDKVNTLTTIKKITSGSTPDVADEVDALYNTIIKAGTWKASSLKVAEAAKVRSFQVLTASSCVPIVGFDVERISSGAQKDCLAQIDYTQIQLPLFANIVMAGKWSYQLESKAFEQALKNFLYEAANRHQRVTILAQLPMFNGNPIRVDRLAKLGITSHLQQLQNIDESNAKLVQIAQAYKHVTVKNFSKIQLFTNAPFHDGRLIYMDAHHLNEVGAVRYAQAIGDQI